MSRICIFRELFPDYYNIARGGLPNFYTITMGAPPPLCLETPKCGWVLFFEDSALQKNALCAAATVSHLYIQESHWLEAVCIWRGLDGYSITVRPSELVLEAFLRCKLLKIMIYPPFSLPTFYVIGPVCGGGGGPCRPLNCMTKYMVSQLTINMIIWWWLSW